jgi:Zn-dependent peptidase ImmA (M78 family)
MDVLHSLRALSPTRPLHYVEAIRVAELQADRLLGLQGVEGPPVRESVITDLPRFQVARVMLVDRASGASKWSKGQWVIVVNAAHPPARQRFSIAHEFKHCVDAPLDGYLYCADPRINPKEQAEQAANFFAGCLLMPRRWVNAAWVSGVRDVHRLAVRFDVSEQAMAVRLNQIGLLETPNRTRHRVAA